MLPFGPHLLAVDETNLLKMWDIKAEEVSLELSFSPQSFTVSALVHPVTYINKVLVASTQGSMQLWNLKTAKQVYAFNGWKSPVTILEQAPAVDVVAVGLASGDIMLHNLKFDETVVKFRQEWGPITALTFRTDGAPIMITGSTQGHLAVWDLEQQTLVHQHRHAHRGAVTGLKSLPSEPLIVTSSPDNSLKVRCSLQRYFEALCNLVSVNRCGFLINRMEVSACFAREAATKRRQFDCAFTIRWASGSSRRVWIRPSVPFPRWRICCIAI